MILGGSLASSWLQGRSSWGSKGFFPSSCVRELCLSVRSRQLSHNSLLEVPAYSLGQARALMGLSAQLEEELDFREGDVINIVGIPEPGWFEGELRGRRGIFPEGFVELLTPLRAAGTSEDQEPAGTCDTNGTVPTKQEEDGKEDGGQEPGSTYGVALYQFQALESEELDFDVGDRIRIVGILEDGWLEGELRGKRGIFPHRFVRLEASDLCREKVSAGDPQTGGSCEVTIHQDLESTCSKVLPLPDKDSWDKEDGLVAQPEPDAVVSHTAGRSEAPLGTDLRQYQAFPDTGLQELHPKTTADSLPFECTKTVNGLLPSTQLPPQQSSEPGQAGALEPPALPERDGGGPTVPPQVPCSPPDICRGQAISSPNSWAASEPQENQSRIWDLDGWVDDQQKSKPCSSGWGGVHMGQDTWAGSWGECSSVAAQGHSGADLDSKLTEQLVQFEKSLSSTSAEQDKVSRHFSILDYSSEKDIVRGSPVCAPHAKLPERRKALRPPPPRPSTLATTPVPKGRSLSFSVKPSRPAPRPPSSTQWKNMVPSQLQPNVAEQHAEESHEDATQTGSASPCSILLIRIGEVERDLEAYRKTRTELSLLLEEQQDELVRAETLENLDFCDSNIKSLSVELQELRGEYSSMELEVLWDSCSLQVRHHLSQSSLILDLGCFCQHCGAANHCDLALSWQERVVWFVWACLGSENPYNSEISAVNYVILGNTIDKVEAGPHTSPTVPFPQLLQGALTVHFCSQNPRCAGNVGSACGRWSEMPAPASELLTLTSLPPASHHLISSVESRHSAAGSCLMQSTWE